MNRKILLISHGPMAEAMKASAAMLTDTSNLYAEGLYEDDSPENFRNKIETYIIENEEILILCDLPGGTPCNSALTLQEKNPLIKIIAGMNLPLLLEALLADSSMSLDLLCDSLVKKGKDFCLLMKLSESSTEVTDDLDSEME